jgi:pantoate--beta-alanine ligase
VTSTLPPVAGALADLDHLAPPDPELGPRAVVMTMGALHDGHLDLVRAATARTRDVIVTDFVNPLQFAPSEDYDAYPRTLDADRAALAGTGVRALYAPSLADMYPAGPPDVRVTPGTGPLADAYEGAARPGHFSGVLTVVAKLLARTRAELAFFGEKDAQQLALVRRLVRDLDLRVEIVAVPTRREADGLALSSRNRRLTAAQRAAALALPRALAAGRRAAADGEGAGAVLAAAGAEFGAPPDYLALVRPDDFAIVPPDGAGSALLIGALRVGPVRLLDNAPLTLAPGRP